MKTKVTLLLILCFLVFPIRNYAQNVFSVKGSEMLLNGEPFLPIGFRCPNAIISDDAVNSLISHLDEYKFYGLNTISVFFMGSRYSDIYGYNLDASLNEVYKSRMEKIIEASDKRQIVVLVGILYWGSGQDKHSNSHYESWTQLEVNKAMVNTIKWLRDNNLRNVFIDPDNEGMAERGAKFNIAEMIRAGKNEMPEMVIAYNNKKPLPEHADLAIHFGLPVEGKPYIQSEGTPKQYWGEYSKEEGLKEYINVGVYTKGKSEQVVKETMENLEKGNGYLFASTWLQNIPPNFNLGGDGSPCNPGIKWWCEFVKDWINKK